MRRDQIAEWRGGNWDRRQTERKQYWNGSFPALITDSLANEILRMFLCHSWDSDDSWQLRSQTEIDCLHPLGNNTSVWGTTWEWQRRWFYHHLHLQLPFLEHVRLSSLSLSLHIFLSHTHFKPRGWIFIFYKMLNLTLFTITFGIFPLLDIHIVRSVRTQWERVEYVTTFGIPADKKCIQLSLAWKEEFGFSQQPQF